MIPPSRAFSPSLVCLAGGLAAILCASGCASAGGLGPLDGEKERRHPDGVAIDPVGAPPPARDHAAVADGLVTLRTPLGADRAVATVDELFRKVVVEDGDGLEAIFTRDAVALSPAAGGGSGQSPSALLLWQGRFRKLDYTKLAGEPIYREAELQIFRAADALEALPHPSVHPEALGENDVVVRVPILTTRIGSERLFGDDLVLWMRRDGDRYRIYRILEDFQLN
jgi:hypothetical protein